MPADGHPTKAAQARTSVINYISGGRGGRGGDGQGSGAGGAGGDGMGPSLSFDIPVGHFMMHNNVNLNSGFHAEYSDYQNGVGGDSWQGFHSAPLIHQNIYQRGDQGIYILHRVAAVEAIHDSAESFPQPRCHPETRTKMLEDLYEWAVDPHPQSTVLWLYGPAGAGKSAIMQTLARQLQDAGRLAGSFFFKRGHATRGNAKTLFATIAYQLALSVLSLRMRISQIVEHNPSILIRSMQTQMDKLILEPCRLHGNRDSMTILIDGLDECEGHDVQREILSAIRTVRATNFLSLRFIVASRPEPHICEGFNTPVYVGNYRSFNVEQSFEDVRKYLCDEFSRIHREHRTMASVAHPWPSPDLLDELVDRSSGHFIYAATIINFIDDKNYRPTQQLKAVQEGNIVGSTPAFDTLDQLYMTILSSTPRQAELIPILCAIVNFDLRLHEVDQLFALEDDEAGLLLRGLHSVLHVPSEDGRRSSISSHHASFLDFLNNPSRSHHFYVGDLDHRMAVARSFLRLCASGRYEPPWSHKRTPWDHLISFLVSLPPTPELCPLIASIGPNVIFTLDHSQFGDMLSWLKKIPSAPQDLIELWEDYVFMISLARDDTACSVKHIVSLSSELCLALIATVFLGMGIRTVRRLLDIEWTDFRTVLCSVRPNIASHPEQVLHGSPRDVVHALVPPEKQQAAFRELALNCIHRVSKCHVQDGVDDEDAWYDISTVLERCPACDILYRVFQSIPLRAMQSQISKQRWVTRGICKWFESFGDPTLELVALD